MFDEFREVVLLDSEFHVKPGSRPDPICVAARLLKSGRVVRLRQGEFGSQPPFPVDDQTLVCAYFASADLVARVVESVAVF